MVNKTLGLNKKQRIDVLFKLIYISIGVAILAPFVARILEVYLELNLYAIVKFVTATFIVLGIVGYITAFLSILDLSSGGSSDD